MFKLALILLFLIHKDIINGSDDFWPRAEENLLKAFEFKFLENISDQNTLTNVYKNIANGDINEIDKLFKGVPDDNPARMSYNIFASGSDTIKASVITGLGTRLQMFQNEDLQKLTAESDIDIAIIIDGVQASAIRERFIEWNSEMDMKYDRVFSIVDIEKSQMEKWGNVLPFYKNIKKEGVVLWKAA